MNDLENARAVLEREDLSVVLCRGTSVLTSGKHGVAPMLDFLSSGEDLRGYSAADKIVGKAAALLFVKTGVVAVWGEVMSKAALPVFDSHGISCSCRTLVDRIVNRAGTGSCPMELTVAGIDDPDKAETALRQKLAALRGN